MITDQPMTMQIWSKRNHRCIANIGVHASPERSTSFMNHKQGITSNRFKKDEKKSDLCCNENKPKNNTVNNYQKLLLNSFHFNTPTLKIKLKCRPIS